MVFSKQLQKLEQINDFKVDANNKDSLPITKGRDVKDEYLKHLKAKCWWLNEKWSNKTVNQQVTIAFMDYRIDLYNFSQKIIHDWHLTVLKRWMAHLLGFSIGDILQKVQYILIDDADRLNPFSGQAKFGSIDIDKNAIIVYPAGLSEEEYRFGEITRWEGILWHEIAHWLEPGLFHRWQWMEKFGWVELNQPTMAPGGAELHWKCNQPERCISDYAKINLMDDFAESFVAVCFCPELLDQEKFFYLSSKMMMKKKIYPIQIDARLRLGEQIVHPFLYQPLYYKWIESGIRLVN